MMLDSDRYAEVLELLRKEYPDVRPALEYTSPFELLVSTMLAAQCTDRQVNKCTAVLYQKYNTPAQFAEMTEEELEPYIKSCGFFHTKGKNIIAMSRILMAEYGGEVPRDRDALTKLPGVGRKTANLILGDIYRVPGSVVCDTHCIRICGRLGLSEGKEPEKVERQLRKVLPPEESSDFCHRIVFFGREVCTARNPKCGECPLAPHCSQMTGNP